MLSGRNILGIPPTTVYTYVVVKIEDYEPKESNNFTHQ
jgi:hypothetical protein